MNPNPDSSDTLEHSGDPVRVKEEVYHGDPDRMLVEKEGIGGAYQEVVVLRSQVRRRVRNLIRKG